MKRRTLESCLAMGLLLLATLMQSSPARADEPNRDSAALGIFQKRIAPILQAPNPSSCSECHLSGVDLKDYILPDQQGTFRALVAGGLIDTADPEKSKILEFIRRRPEKPSLITDRVRKEEYAAFRAWILAAVKDPALLDASTPAETSGPRLPMEVIRHARRDRVLSSFIENVWSEVGRCAACHSPEQNQKHVKKFGERVSWIKPRDPEGTLSYLVESGVIDLDSPAESLLLAKPSLQVKHQGGRKMMVGDRTYNQFRRFIEDYAAVVNGSYTSANQLPPQSQEVSALSPVWLKITGIPSKYNDKLLEVDLYRREGSGWSTARWATSERIVIGASGSSNWQHELSVTAPRGSDRVREIRESPTLPAGEYQIRILVDVDNKLEKNYPARLGDEDRVADVVIESRWPAGYGRMTVIKFPGH